MELRKYWVIVRRWWWLLFLCTALAGTGAFLFSSRSQRQASLEAEPTYEASTIVVVGDSLDLVNPSAGEMQGSRILAQTYAELLKTRAILDATARALNLPATPEVSVSLLKNTQLIQITVADSDAQRAAATANELAHQLTLRSPSAQRQEEQGRRQFVRQQLRELEGEITALSKAILDAGDTAAREEIARLQEELNTSRHSYITLLDYVRGGFINCVRVLEPAVAPTHPPTDATVAPVESKVAQNTVLGAAAGLLSAIWAAFLIDYLDDSVRGRPDIEQVLGLATLGTIPQIPSKGASPATITRSHPDSPYAEAYRMLRTNLRYSLPSSAERGVFLVTSSGPGEGKTTTVSNLGAVLAQEGRGVIIVDSDLRRPSLHHLFACSNEVGLTSWLEGEIDSVELALQPSDTKGLQVLPCGPSPGKAPGLLGSPRMVELLKELSQRVDMVILDSPSLFEVVDAGILASLVTGTILVVEAGRTPREACARAAEMINKAGGNLLGVVLNRLKSKRAGVYSYF